MSHPQVVLDAAPVIRGFTFAVAMPQRSTMASRCRTFPSTRMAAKIWQRQHTAAVKRPSDLDVIPGAADEAGAAHLRH